MKDRDLFKIFINYFELTQTKSDLKFKFQNDEINSLFSQLGGQNVNKGLFKIYTEELSQFWNSKIQSAGFSTCKDFIPFGQDWLGRQFAYCYNDCKIEMIDIATFKKYELEDVDLKTFLNIELIEYKQEYLYFNDFKTWVIDQDLKLELEQCVGYSKSLFLGGSDELSNYEIYDTTVYWDLNVMIYNKIKDLPDGTPIDSIKFE